MLVWEGELTLAPNPCSCSGTVPSDGWPRAAPVEVAPLLEDSGGFCGGFGLRALSRLSRGAWATCVASKAPSAPLPSSWPESPGRSVQSLTHHVTAGHLTLHSVRCLGHPGKFLP